MSCKPKKTTCPPKDDCKIIRCCRPPPQPVKCQVVKCKPKTCPPPPPKTCN